MRFLRWAADASKQRRHVDSIWSFVCLIQSSDNVRDVPDLILALVMLFRVSYRTRMVVDGVGIRALLG